MSTTRHQAIKQADEQLAEAGLPTYSEMVLALREGAGRVPHTSDARTKWLQKAFDLLRRAGAA
jgi:hypothetical protein